MSFCEKLNAAIARNQSLLFVALDPNPEMLPHRYDSIWDWLQAIIAETADYVCAYKPTLGFYQALGSEGFQLLSQVLAAIPQHIPVILDAKHGDLNTSTVFANTIFEKWQVDAVTLNPYAGQDCIALLPLMRMSSTTTTFSPALKFPSITRRVPCALTSLRG